MSTKHSSADVFIHESVCNAKKIKQATRAFRSQRERLNCLSKQKFGGGARRPQVAKIMGMGQLQWGWGRGRERVDDWPQQPGLPDGRR